MKNYTATLEISVLVDVPVRADSMEDALAAARKKLAQDALKPKTKKNSIIDWEVTDITSVYDG